MKFLCSLICFLLIGTLVHSDEYDFVRNGEIGVLSTDYKGTPFGSLTPYVLHEGRPVIFVSDLAVHTKNFTKNPACSLTVFNVDKKNIFNSARITFVGKMVKMDKTELDKIKKLYFNKFKDAEQFRDFADFNFYKMEVKEIFWVGGFGDIGWLDVDLFFKAIKK